MATASKQAQKEAPTYTFEVVSTLHHNGDEYKVGDTVELTEQQALPLLDHTVRAPAAKK